MDVSTEVMRFLALEPESMRCPVDAFSALREEAPVVEVPEMDLFVVTGREEVLEVFRDWATFSSAQHANRETAHNFGEMLRRAVRMAEERGQFDELMDDPEELHPLALPHGDPPKHTLQRKLVQPAFTVRRARASEEMLKNIADDLIDGFIDDGHVELRTQYSDPLMLRFVLRELHASPDDAATLLSWVGLFAKVQGSKLTDDELDEVASARLDFDSYFLERIAQVRAEPADDLLSRMAHAEEEGKALSTGELLMICQSLLVGGTETSSTTTSKAVLHLAANPELADELRKDPDLVPAFVEETLRLNGPIHMIFRRTTKDVVLGGVEIPAGARVGLHLGAAGRDPNECPMPEAVDLRRDQPHQLMFGFGVHYCAGAELGRVQVRTALGRLLQRTAHFELDVPEQSLTFYPQVNLHRLAELPLRFTKA